MIYARSNYATEGELIIGDWKINFTSSKTENWNWIKTEVPKDVFLKAKLSLMKINCRSGNLEIDKIIVSDTSVPDLKNY